MFSDLNQDQIDSIQRKTDFRLFNKLKENPSMLDVFFSLNIPISFKHVKEESYVTKFLYKKAYQLTWQQKEIECINTAFTKLKEIVDVDLENTKRTFFQLNLPIYPILVLLLEPDLISTMYLTNYETPETIYQTLFSGE